MKKWRKYLLIILMGILGLLLIVLLVLNLPFTQRFATGKVNQILSSSSVPIHLDAIRKIMPGSVSIQGLVITGIQGDTIIYAGELEADIRLISLLRSHVMLKKVLLDGVLVELARKNSAEKLNIAAAFQSGRKKDAVPLKKPPAKWEITIKKGALSNIHFLMQDSLSGIHITQDASEIDLAFFRVSLPTREIFCRSFLLEDAEGEITLTPRLIPPRKKKGSPWNMGFNKLDLKDVDFKFAQEADSLEIETSIGTGNIKANKLELLSRTADFKLISLDESIVTVQSASGSKKQKKEEKDQDDSFPWTIRSDDIDIKKLTAKLGSESGKSFKDVDIRMEDLRLDKDQAGMKLRNIAFEMENGFSLKKMSGVLNSEGGDTWLQFDIKSGNSLLELEGFAKAGFLDILSAPVEISKGTLDVRKSRFSLLDLSCFIEDLDSLAFYNLLAASSFDVSAKLNIEGPLFTLSECSVSQEKNFNITADGNLNNPFRFSDATGDIDLELSDLDQVWLEEFAAGFGGARALPDLSDLKIRGSISDSLMSPDLHLSLLSQWGEVDLQGNLDISKELFLLAYSFKRLAVGDILFQPDLGFFTGTGKIKGNGFSGEQLSAGFYLQIDSLEFRSYAYTHTQVTGSVEPGDYDIQMVVNDPSLKGDLNVELTLADSSFQVQSSGILQAQLNNLHLYEDTLSIETSVTATLASRGETLEAELKATGIKLSNQEETAVVQELNASFRSDSLTSRFHTDADFFHADLHLMNNINELDSLGKGYQHYFASFREASHITAADRVTVLPEINAVAHIVHHELLDIFIQDTGLNFTNLDLSLRKQADQNSLKASVHGDDLSFKMIDSGHLNATLTDSSGSILIGLSADSTTLFSGPEHHWMLNADFSGRKMLARLSVNDYQHQTMYEIDLAGEADSTQILLEIPDQLLTLNGKQWQLDRPDLLSIDLVTNRFMPSLQMKRDSSNFHLYTLHQDPFFIYTLDLNQVELASLIRTDLFKGSPEGTFSGSVEFKTNQEIEKNIDAKLQISDIRYTDEELNDIQLDGALSMKTSGAYAIDLLARMDSINVRVNGKKAENGKRNLDGEFTHFPLLTLEPFIEKYLSEIGGSISGKLNISSHGGSEQFNGELSFQDAGMKVNMLNSLFRIPDQRILISDEQLKFEDFTILDTMDRPLKLDGFFDFRNPASVIADLNITSTKLQVMSRDKRSKVPFTGNVFIDSRVSVKGPISQPDIAGRIHLSEGTEIYYQHMEDLRMTETNKIVNFVDRTSVDEDFEASVVSQSTTLLNTSIETVIEVDPSTMVNFTLTKRMFDIFLNVQGGGKIQYNMENERMSISGRYEIGDGTTLLKLVGWPDKSFSLSKGGFINWDGRIQNPQLNIEAESKVSTSYVNPIDNKNRDIDFFVILRLSDYLSDLNVQFTIRTPDQYVMSIINTLSPEEQMRQAISVLLFEVIDLPGISSSTDYMTQQVNQILSSQLNQFTKSAIKGVDISFGLDTYDQTSSDGGDGTSTSLSYDVSKSLLKNRGQIEVSGRFNDDTQQTGSSDHSLNNVSFEYQLDSAASKYLKVYNEHTYDDVFDGEVVQTGIGFSYRKRYKTFRDIWRRKK